ncbi:MAG: PspC domain-containing protein [Nitriliruptorales bacterium]
MLGHVERQVGEELALFERSSSDRVIAGVAAGLAHRLGVDVLLVRIALVVLAAAGGSGIVLYLLGWLVSSESSDDHDRSTDERHTDPRQALALGLILLGTLLLLRDLGLWFGDAIVWPVALAAVGSAVIWARSSEDDRERWSRLGARIPGNPVEAVFGGRASLGRVIVGGLLVAVGLAASLAANTSLAGLGPLLVGAAVATAGLGLVLGPWVLRLARQVTTERGERIRAEERAEVAAHLHDSVLQTLALLQRSTSQQEMVALARRQERELRAWLYGQTTADGELLGQAIDALVEKVEADHDIVVDAIVVGDGPLDERLRALVEAAGEAVVNAAKHAGVTSVSLYVERRGETAEAYVRDRGRGFDPAAVGADRRGIAHSIRGRVERWGGEVLITTALEEGTEVRLRLPAPTLHGQEEGH